MIPKLWRRLRSFFIAAFLMAGLGVVIVLLIDRHVTSVGGPQCYETMDRLPYNKVGLLLGTSKFTKQRRENPHYIYRIDAAEKLFKAGKIEYILASGDNSKRAYDEPTQMKADLVMRGIPADRIVLDYAGFRTLDSVVRAQKIFQQEKFTIISQRFHNERAIYLAQSRGIQAVGFDAEDVAALEGLRTKLREKFARTAAFLDLNVWHRQPRFLGEPVMIGR